MSTTRAFFFAPIIALAVTTACVTTMAIRSMEPGRVYVGGARELLLVETQGRRSAREFVTIDLIAQARSWGYFSVEDLSEEGFGVRIGGRRAFFEGPDDLIQEGTAGLRIDVLEWNHDRSTRRVQKTAEDGTVYEKHVNVQEGSTLLAITLFDAEGSAFLAEAEYEGHFETSDMQMPRDEVIERASQQALTTFLQDITPIQVTTQVRLDDEDEGQEQILGLARAGSVGKAAEDMRAYLARDPNNASAAYNLAVFLEAMGHYDEALEMYERALSLGGKDYYVSAHAGCAQRLQATESLAK